jgi:hypothetical protein
MSGELEQMGNEIFVNQVPAMWAEVGFLSLKPLAAWELDFMERLQFLTSWLEEGKPVWTVRKILHTICCFFIMDRTIGLLFLDFFSFEVPISFMYVKTVKTYVRKNLYCIMM